MVGRDAFHAALGPLQGLWARRGRRSGLRRPRHEDVLISVVRPPGRDAIEEAVAREWRGDVVIAPRENSSHVAAALPGWKAVSATLHLLGDAPQLPHVPAGAVRLFAPPELAAMDWLPPDLLSEFRVAYSPIAASLADGHPVSFWYAAAQTEGLWDISIKIEGKSY